MTGYHSSLINFAKNDYSLHVELGDNANYAPKGIGSTLFQLDSRDFLHMSDILFVSISVLEDKVYKVSFVDNRVLVWPKDSNIDSTRVIGV